MGPMEAELLKEFLWSTRDELAALEAQLLQVEDGQAADAALVNSVYRTFHSVKGGAGLVQLSELERAAHAGENLLARLREDASRFDASHASAFLIFVDGAKRCLDAAQHGLAAEPELFQPFIESLQSLSSGEPPRPRTGQHAQAPQPSKKLAAAAAVAPPAAQAAAPAKTAQPVASAATPAPSSTPAPASPLGAHPEAPPSKESKEGDNKDQGDGAVRVNVHLLDELMNQVGELVLTRNRLLQLAASSGNHGLQAICQGLDQVTSGLQDNIMRTRMQPVAAIFNKFPRVVRDLSKQLGKKIELEISGQETELDRTILDSMRDPFTHIIRNSCDHGIESIEQRRAAGKPEVGRISLKAWHEGGQVIVEVRDDGKGIDTERVKAKAIACGLLSAEQAARLPDAEACLLICHPGLSTAEAVTNISGRGVGMDVVKSNIEAISGSLEITSQRGVGTTLRIAIPLTLAIIPALMVSAGDLLFGIPQINLVELVGLDPADTTRSLEEVRGATVLRLREALLPVLSLRGILGLPPQAAHDGMHFVVIVAAGDQRFGIVVDSVLDTEEIVVKALDRHCAGHGPYAGATIRGDGRICLIVDVAGIAREHNIHQGEFFDSEETHDETNKRTNDEHHEFLVFHCGGQERFGIPLQLVARIEQVPARALGRVGGRSVITRKQGLIPAVLLEEHAAAKPLQLTEGEDSSLYLIVINTRRSFAVVAAGLVDSQVIDLTHSLDDPQVIDVPAISALVALDEGPCALLDVHRLAETAFPVSEKLKERHHQSVVADLPVVPTPKSGGALGRILYCEDAQFFQNAVSGYLRDAGHHVDVCPDGQAGWERLQAHQGEYNLIITDLEMPRMDGWELMRTIRSRPELDNLPIIALTSLGDAQAREASLKAGAAEHVIKLQRDELLTAIQRVLGQEAQV